MKSGSSNVWSANLAGIRSPDRLKKSRFVSSWDHATVVCETFHTVSEEVFSELRLYGVLRSSCIGASRRDATTLILVHTEGQ
jgi:hypothetical protein